MLGEHRTSLVENMNAFAILKLMWWYFVVRNTEWKVWKTPDVSVLGGAGCSHKSFHRGRENSRMDQNWWIHLLVVPVFQGAFIIRGISVLVTVEFRKNNERFSDPPLTDDRALKLVNEVIDTDWCSTVGDTAVICDLKRTTAQYFFKVGVQTLGCKPQSWSFLMINWQHT